MKSYQFQKLSKKILPYAFFCGLILLFAYGAPFAGSDFALSSRAGNGGIGFWLREAGGSGGNYISAFLRAIMVDVPILRHLLLATMLSTAAIALLFFCGAERPYMHFVILFLSLAAPKAIFAYTFSGVIGGATYMIPAFLTVMYLFTLSDLFVYKGNKKGWKIPFLFLSGFAVQMFSESIGVALLIISVVSLILLWRKYGFNWHLMAHAFGCILGLSLNLILSGSVDAVSNSFYAMVDQFTVVLDQLFVENILLLSVLTFVCLLLIQPIRLERSKNCNITLLLLLVPMGLFLVLNVLNEAMVPFTMIYRALSIVKLILALSYCLGILRTVQHYVSKDKVIYRVRYALLGVLVFALVYTATGTAMPGMLYIPYLLMVGITGLMLVYALRHYDRMEKVLRKPLFFAAVAGVLALSVITIANGKYCEIVDTHIRDNLQAGKTEITLPVAPYAERLAATDLSDLSDYYDFPAYGEVDIDYVPYEQWDWMTYYEAHNVPVIEEYDEEMEKTEDWAYEFEEDE